MSTCPECHVSNVCRLVTRVIMRWKWGLLYYEGGLKSSSLAYNRRETRDKLPLGKEPDWSRCNLHTRLKLFGSRSMATWISSAAYECAAAQSMHPWTAIKKTSQEGGGDISSCQGPYPTAAYPEFHVRCRLDGELFSLPVCCPRCSWKSLKSTRFSQNKMADSFIIG